LDESIFSSWIEEEQTYQKSHRLSIEAVSFTQQKPLKVSKPLIIPTDAISSFDEPSPKPVGNMGGTFSDKGPSAASGSRPTHQFSDTKDQNPTNSLIIGNRAQTANDPFYLTSSPATLDLEDSSNTDAKANLPISFGQIELGEDNEVGDTHSKKKKKKKDKKNKAQVSTGGLGKAFGNVTIYDSEDDDDDGDIGLQPSSRKTGGRTKGSVLNGLASVDLSAPLREDEVFLERKHRVVPERAAPIENSKLKKKKKKSSKKNKKEANPQVAPAETTPQTAYDPMNQQIAQAPTSGFDLLDLYSAPLKEPPSQQTFSSAQTSQPMGVMPGQTGSVNNAFDDLLGFSNPSPQPSVAVPKNNGSNMFGAPNQSSYAQSFPKSEEKEEKPYLRATIKASSASGSPSVDWSKIELSYHVSRVNMAVSMVVRVRNYMGSSSLGGLVLQVNNYGGISIGDIGPNSTVESSNVGPFSYPHMDVPLELKGKLTTRDSSVKIKLVLPISVFVSPPGVALTLDHVASELASSQWASHSTKISHNSSVSPESIKRKVCTFLNMIEIEPADPTFGTMAGKSSTGVPIRVLVKVGADSVKVDIKSGNVAFGKALTSELKKLII
jgi:hypothetical protein